MKLKNVIISIILLGVLSGGYVYFFVLNKEHPDFEHLNADYKLPAQSLYNDFVKDSEKASEKYNGKMLQLSGRVDEIEKVDSLSIAVFVFNEGMFGNEGVRCTFLPSEQIIENASDIHDFEIKGYCSGFNDTDVILEKCSLVK